MQIHPLKIPKGTKLMHIQPGALVTVYNEKLVESGKFIKMVDDPASVGMCRVLDPITGQLCLFNPSMIVVEHRGAAIILDYIEGA